MRHTLLLLVFSLLSFFAKAQWTLLDEPDGGEVTCLEKVGSQLWAGTGAGVYVSNDEGDSWIKSPLPYFSILDIAVFSDSVFMLYNSGNSSYLILSTDTGVNWSTPLPVGNAVFHSNGRIYQTGNQLMVDFDAGEPQWFSTDNGQTWFDRQPYIFSSISPRAAYCRVYNAGRFDSYYYNSETDSFIFIDTLDFNFVQVRDTVIYSIRKDQTQGYLTRSADYGQTWDTVHIFPTPGIAYRLRESNDTLFAGSDFTTNDGVYSVDNGLTWTPTPVYPILLIAYNDYLAISNNDFLGSDFNGVIRFSAGPIAYYRNIGINAIFFNRLFTYNGIIYATHRAGTTRSLDGGASWSQWTNLQVTDIQGRNDTVCAAAYYFTDTPPDAYIIRSYDNGNTSAVQYQGMVDFIFAFADQLRCRFRSSGELLYTYTSVIRSSSTEGATWQDNPVPTPAFYLLTMELLNDELYILNQNNEFYKEVNGNWNLLYTCPSNSFVVLKKLNNTLVLSSSDSLRYSDDGGLTWNFAAGNGLPLSASNTPVFPTNISTDGVYWYGALSNTGVVYSSDQGANWTIIQTPFRPYYTPVVINNEIYCIGYNAGIWKAQLPLAISDGKKEKRALRVYPNPARTRITFTDLLSANATYRMYDNQGKIVQSGNLINSSQIEVSNLPSGFYCGVVVDEKNNSTQSFRFIKE